MNDLNLTPNDREVRLEPGQDIISKYSADLLLEYINEYFEEFSGFKIHDELGNSFDSVKHYDMPQTILNIIDQHIVDKKNINLIIKNEIKDGRFYWFLTDFKFKINEDESLNSMVFYRKSPSRIAIPVLDNLYKKLIDIEKHVSMEVAEKYLEGFLEEKKMSFKEYTKHLSQEEGFAEIKQKSPRKQKKSLMKKLFGK